MMRMMIAVALLAMAFPVSAKVHEARDTGFIVRHQIMVPATPEEVWAQLVTPARWWNKANSFSGDAANLTLDARPGGCFCETLPGAGADSPRRGGVEHMRVINVARPRVLRMTGAIGPLQSEAVQGTLTIVLKKTDVGTGILWEYVVGGFMRKPVGEVAPGVDALLRSQLARLGARLGARGQPGAEPESEGGAMDAREAQDGEEGTVAEPQADSDNIDALFDELIGQGAEPVAPEPAPDANDAPFIGR